MCGDAWIWKVVQMVKRLIAESYEPRVSTHKRESVLRQLYIFG